MMKIKKLLAAVLSLMMILPCFAFADGVSFPDLAADHWAYSAVMTLVGDGTIKGFEDGTFKPDATVSRAEFVKMIGAGDSRRDSDYSDVNSEHWGYEYIMTSGMAADSAGNFNPDVAITRYDVAELIWKRNGAVKDCKAPKFVVDQATNADVAAWVYSYGIMVGDDGVNLRLGDTLTRAEAASLIVRARTVKDRINFVDKVDADLLKTVYNNTNLFDGKAYNPNATITNGEMALAAIRLTAEQHNVTYEGLYTKQPFDSKYSRAVYNIGTSVLGEDVISESFSNKTATIQDTLAVMTYYAVNKARNGIKLDNMNNYYSDAKTPATDAANQALTFAYENGISLYADEKINADKSITLKELSAILLQLDYIVGFEPTMLVSGEISKIDSSTLIDPVKYPSNASDYQLILKDVPTAVYEKAFINAKGLPKDKYDFLREYQIIITNMLVNYHKMIQSEKGANLQFVYYPSMNCKNADSGYTMRLRVDVKSAPSGATVGSLFNVTENADASQAITSGMSFYADFVSGQIIDSIYPDCNKIAFDQMVFVK